MSCHPETEEAVDGTPLYKEDPLSDDYQHDGANDISRNALSRFRVQGYKDLWAAVLFVVLLIATTTAAVVNYFAFDPSAYIHGKESKEEGGSSVSSMAMLLTTIYTLLSCLFIFRLSLGALVSHSVALILAAFILNSVMCLITGLMIMSSAPLFGILLIFSAIISLVWLMVSRGQVDFTAKLLESAAVVVRTNSGMVTCNFVVAGLTCLYIGFTMVWMALPTFMRISAAAEVDASAPRKDGDIQLTSIDGLKVIFFAFALYWVVAVAQGVMHVTSAGVAATWFFAGPLNMPPNPSWLSFVRATTTSFGSICFAALVTAVVQTFRFITSVVRDEARRNDHAALHFIALVLECILGCVEALLHYFNLYALVYVAIYGSSYIEASKKTWELPHKISAIFADCLVRPVCGFLALGTAVAQFMLVGLVSNFALGTIAGVEAFAICSLAFSSVESAVNTFFVCYVEFPDSLRNSAPQFYEEVQAFVNDDVNL